MGGIGSGGWNRSGRATTSDRDQLDIALLRREDVLTAGAGMLITWRVGEVDTRAALVDGDRDGVTVVTAADVGGDDEGLQRQRIGIMWRPCRFGGERPYFVCPDCGARRLHLFADAGRFICRDCASLTYATRRERSFDRALRVSSRIRHQLNAPSWFEQVTPDRPAGMHRRTFGRLLERLSHAEERACGDIMRFLESFAQKRSDDGAEAGGFWR